MCLSIREAPSRILLERGYRPQWEPELFGIEFNTMTQEELLAAAYFLQAECLRLRVQLGE